MSRSLLLRQAAERAGLKYIDAADQIRLLECGISANVSDNIKLFSRLSFFIAENLSCVAVSPYSGKTLTPFAHIGIDSDPWLHAIAYEEEHGRFFVFCQGLTQASCLGGVYLPNQKVLVGNPEGWHANEVLVLRLSDAIQATEEYLEICQAPPCLPSFGTKRIVASIGNKRLGDFLKQLVWLEHLMRREPWIHIDHLIVNAGSEFYSLKALFPDLADRTTHVQSINHVKCHARHFEFPLMSDAWSLSDDELVNALASRMTEHAVERTIADGLIEAENQNDNHALSIWLSVEIEKRVWKEQSDELPRAISLICDHILGPQEPVRLVFNGLTGVENKREVNDFSALLEIDKCICQEISRHVTRPVHFVWLGGETLRKKISVAQQCDFFVAPIGPASVVPSKIVQLPGIVYGTRIDQRTEFIGSHTVCVKSKHHKSVSTPGYLDWGTANCRTSYSLTAEPICDAFRESFEVANKRIGKTFIKRARSSGSNQL